MTYRAKQSGVSIFIAVTIMGILILISFAVVNITIKSSQFASTGRDSQYAFYAADAGIECAVYWDGKFDSFATSTPGSVTCAANPAITTNSQNPIAGTTTASRVGGGTDANPTSVFGLSFNTGSEPVNSCAIITVRKYYQGGALRTYIKSRGYNTCDTTNPRRVERGVEVTY